MPARRHDYIPSNAAQFKEFMRNLIMYVEAHAGPGKAWANIPAARVVQLRETYMKFDEAFDIALETPTHANVERRREAQAMTAGVTRAFVNQFLRFPPVTNPDRIEMGVPVHDTIRTDHKVVTEIVDFVIRPSAVRQLRVDFWVQGADRRAKPEGYDGAVIIWGVSGAPPESPEELEHHLMASRTPFTLHFEEPERGGTVQIAMCWQNERGIRGAWSGYKAAVIP